MNQCCCCDFLHNPVNKRIAWWLSFSFLLGVLACCISAFVTVNRFGFALEGAWCAVDRIYYDSLYGQLKKSKQRWNGLNEVISIIDNVKNFCTKKNEWSSAIQNIQVEIPILNEIQIKVIYSIQQIQSYCQDTTELPSMDEKSFKEIKSSFLDDFEYYAKTLRACLKILAMIYYCLLLIAITAAGVSMMFYACLKRQGYLITFMHVLWNVIRFFMFSFFLYGTAYGIAFLSIRDSIAVINYIFEKNLNEDEPKYLKGGKDFLNFCLYGENKNMLNETIKTSFHNYFDNIDDLMKIKEGSNAHVPFVNLNTTICGKNKDQSDEDKVKAKACNEIKESINSEGFGYSFDCGFLSNDLHHLFRTLSDASVESRILAALSLCSSFFGAVAVYFYLLVMHHYNNELFFDSGKSIFTGFDGFGGGYKKKVHDKDPAFKKRKLRAEIELTSKNDEQSAYKNVNKNEEEE